MHSVSREDEYRVSQRAALYRNYSPAFSRWAHGIGAIRHADLTQVRVYDLCQQLVAGGRFEDIDTPLKILQAADTLANAAMWMVVHMTYARRVDTGGRPLGADDFKAHPQGHTGGSLNMVPAYLGYVTANTLAGNTRSWLMGQGHCVAAIDSLNVLLGNLHPEQACRYPCSEDGLSQLAEDFYSYAVTPDGQSGVPLGSHVNPHTAGGLIEGGYLGFAELQYSHMPLPGEHLVAFLSDGAFEEQRGGDWASRWWRAEDCGLVTPVMIANGRRIDQRSAIYLQGGTDWFRDHLALNGFYPMTIDGRDPAAFVWGIFESEARLTASAGQVREGNLAYPLALPYLIAETTKGYGFYGAGTNAAHGTPLPANPRDNADARALFNESAARLFVPLEAIRDASLRLATHQTDQRPLERDHPLARRQVKLTQPVTPQWARLGDQCSPMAQVDGYFSALVRANPTLRVRLGNPDEMRSNRMDQTLDLLKHRTLMPEPDNAESLQGSVITALNEEAVVSAALANKGGMNLVVSYEAFAMKMVGAIRQEVIFARQQKRLGRSPGWLSVPVVATSHTWENGKNEQSHQDPSFGEVLLGEMSDQARVVYPADANSAMACMATAYNRQGEVWALTVPKGNVDTVFDAEAAERLVHEGALMLHEGDQVQLVAVGAYQLAVAREVMDDLRRQDIDCGLTYLLEPGRFRRPRDRHEAVALCPAKVAERLFPTRVGLRVFIGHMRPETLLGICRPLDLGPERTLAFGYANQGGTFDVQGMLLANGCDAGTIKRTITAHLKRH